MFVMEIRKVGNWRTCREHPNYNILKIGQNTEKNPKVERRLAATQTSMKDHQLTLVRNTHNK